MMSQLLERGSKTLNSDSLSQELGSSDSSVINYIEELLSVTVVLTIINLCFYTFRKTHPNGCDRQHLKLSQHMI